MLLDVVFTVVAYLTVLVLRFDGEVPTDYWNRFLKFVPVAVLAHLVSYWAWGLYRQMWRHASVQEARGS